MRRRPTLESNPQSSSLAAVCQGSPLAVSFLVSDPQQLSREEFTCVLHLTKEYILA